MSNINSLSKSISREYAVRCRELTALKLLVESSSNSEQVLLLRLSVPIIYAHWEGFIKSIAIKVLDFIVSQRIGYDLLEDHFKAIAIYKALNAMPPETHNKQVKLWMKILNNEFSSAFAGDFHCDARKWIDTKSNLNKEVVEDILYVFGLVNTAQHVDSAWIDLFVGKRNEIVHGELVQVDVIDFRSYYENIVELLRHFNEQFLDYVESNKFLKVA